MKEEDIEIDKTTQKFSSIILPSHKITITHKSDKYVYWYVKGSDDQDDFDKTKDGKLIEIMHGKGLEMNLGYFESFSIGKNKDYHLERRERYEFVIKRLSPG